jgi:predicted ATPase
MMIKEIKISGLLSFGPEGVALPLKDLNVLIGPNGSGKSNLLEMLALLKAAPKNLAAPINEMGGIREWLWKVEGGEHEGELEVGLTAGTGKIKAKKAFRHLLCVAEKGGRFEVVGERILAHSTHPSVSGAVSSVQWDRFRGGNVAVTEGRRMPRKIGRENLHPEESILSQFKDPERYPALTLLQETYADIRLFQNWSFGPKAALRREQSAQGRNDFLTNGGENLVLVLSKIQMRVKREMIEALRELYGGIMDFDARVGNGGNMQLFLEEEGGREIPATRLSDGTLRYLCLLAVLLHPEPPGLIAIEEPELGLHPDVLPYLGKLLVQASKRTQLVVTTHSPMLVDALGDEPESVVVCEKVKGCSQFTRLNGDKLKEWLEKYSLGTLWSMGEIGGNRW